MKLQHGLILSVILLVACASSPDDIRAPEPPSSLNVKVSRVVEGDIVEVTDTMGKDHVVRLRGVDAPEPDQPYGAGAVRCLNELVAGKVVRMSSDMRNRDGMLVSELYLDSAPVSKMLVERGCVWWDQASAPYDLPLGHIENSARKARRGLWVDRRPVPPWEWRER